MAELKTQKTAASVEKFLAAVADPSRQSDARRLVALMTKITGEAPALWGTSIIGFGSYHYRSDSGREGDWFLTGLSPRSSALSIYVISGLDSHSELVEKLGPHRRGMGCLYVKSLSDLDWKTLTALIRASVRLVRAKDVNSAAKKPPKSARASAASERPTRRPAVRRPR